MAGLTRGRTPAAILVLASLVYCAPLFFHPGNAGREDWDQFSFRYDTPRVAMLRDHVLPVWNPYANGGTVLLAHPDSPFPSPWFLIVMALGAPLGLKVQVVCFMALGAVGMATLVTRMGASRAAAIASGIAFMMSSHFALHLTEGHLEWCVLGLMPWMAICLLRLDQGWRYTIVAALLLASVLTFGAVYIPAVYLPFFSVWIAGDAIRRRDPANLVRWANVVVLAALLSSVKLLPMLQFTADWPREVPVAAGTPPGLMLTGLLDPRQVLLYQVTRDHDLPDGNVAKIVPAADAAPVHARLTDLGAKEGFQEYGAYLGGAGLLLATIGLVIVARRQWPLFAAGVAALLVASGNSLPVDLWAALKLLPLYGQLQVPSRFLAAVVFVLAVAAGLGLDAVLPRLSSLTRLSRAAAASILVVLFAGELGIMGWTLFSDVFVVAPIALERHDTFAHRFTARSLRAPVMSSTMHPYLDSNSGTLDAYENLSVATADVRIDGAPGYRGEVYLDSGAAPVSIRRWTMAGMTVQVAPAAPDSLVVNQNFYRGWKARRRGRDGREDIVDGAATAGGLIAVPVTPEHAEIELFYEPAHFRTGAWLSGGTLALCLLGLWLTRRQSATPLL